MIFRCLLAAAIGFCQVFAIALQTRMLALGRRGLQVFVTSLAISSIWVCGVLAVVKAPGTAVFYVLACAFGATSAARLRLGERRVHSERLPRSLKGKP